MRHRKTGRKLGRNSAHRKAMFRNMTTSLLQHETIKTTLPKAKELRRFAEPVINLAKKHAWANYAEAFDALEAALTDLEAFAAESDENKAAFDNVKESKAKVERRFPSGLGTLLKLVQAQGEKYAEQAKVLADVRSKQMARQHAISQAKQTVSDKEILEKLFGELADKFVGRNGGYTRIIKAGYRDGDNAAMAYISLVFESLPQVEDEGSEGADAE